MAGGCGRGRCIRDTKAVRCRPARCAWRGGMASPRLRAHLLLHGASSDPCQRMLVAIEPSYVPPHRHLDPLKAEVLVALRGVLGVVWFEDGGAVAGSAVLAGHAGRHRDPAGLFHAVIALAPGTAFSSRPRPAPGCHCSKPSVRFAPREGEAGASVYFEGLQARFADRSRLLMRRPAC